MTSNTPTLAERAVASKQRRLERNAQRSEIKEKIRDLEAERQQILSSMPTSDFCEYNSRQIADLKKQFVSALKQKSATGKIPAIDLASPGAIAYFFGDALLAAIPELGNQVSGGGGARRCIKPFRAACGDSR